ncbi:thioester reductase domain-containing protein [Saccharothrix violaceirubra]|uniref:Amino acid adenylation domain-containing protein/thioester reductase-like protein n=1 Tax=Saccharothrix violaceirubra TaxID=413306 RepID=A0A7W7T1Y2_9PSEU|nr:non-ribosomal peptide synthetase [Saccharothrix violaceirubra]MBB4965063.1 amino acid adenylation domain-containing protein/thioester reductase-like protein [Saccharothrix violaceirubra]
MTDDQRERLLAKLMARQGLRSAGLPRRPGGADVPLSGNQRGLWLAGQLGDDSGAYVMYAAIRVTGTLDVERLRDAVAVVVDRHEALRTRVVEVDGVPAQEIVPATASVTCTDVESLDDAVRSEVDTPFDLGAAPLFRVRVFRSDDVTAVVLSAHHIVCDDVSLAVVAEEIGAAYQGGTSFAPVGQFPDFVHWQAGRLAEGDRARMLDHWASRLADAPPVLDLAGDRPRTPHRSIAGDSHRFTVPAALAARLTEVTREQGATTFAGLLAAFAVVLSRRSGTDDVVIGSPTTDRPFPALERAVGMFVTTTALRVDLSGDPTVAELLARTRTTAVEALDHAGVSFDEVTARVAPRRDPAHHPLFQVMLVLNRGSGGGTWAGLPATTLPVTRGTSRFDLTLHVRETDGDWPVDLDYRTDLFSPDTAARLADQVLVTLSALVRDPAARLSTLDTTPPADHAAAEALHGVPVAPVDDVLTRIAAAVANHPDTTAVLDLGSGAEITFAELDRRADHVANLLRSHGVGPSVPVGLAARAGVEGLSGLLGVLKAGGAYVPLDPAHPPARLAGLLESCGAPVVLAPAEVDLGPYGGVVLTSWSGEAEGFEVTRGDLAYVIHTSGSTGTPKGVEVGHASLAHLTDSFVAVHGFAAGHRILMIPPLSFDASVGDVFPAWSVGAAIVVHPEPAAIDGPGLLRLCADHGITAVDAPAALLKRWVADLDGVVDVSTGPLGLVMFGGEAVPVATVAAFARITGGRVRLVNHYGPTETTVCATTFTTVEASEVDSRSATLPIGRPLPGVRAYVLDARLRPVPLGVPGQLHVGGVAPAWGYRDDPARTAAAYLPDPVVPGGRVYRTGDLVRSLPDGNLEFLGRVDDQVKLRGHRIEPGEVRAALLAHPDVTEAAVTVRGDVLVGYVVGAVDPAGVRAFCADRLPAAMLPGAVVVLDGLPLTRHGKVDFAALPDPTPGVEYEAPRTDVERVLAEVWSEVLGVPVVGRRDTFFGLGGHSLVAAAVLGRVRSLLGVTVPLRALFATADLAELAEVVERAHDDTYTFRSGLPTAEQMHADAEPPADIVPAATTVDAVSRVFLTGSTGFLGAYLLSELLARSSYEVHCLVRAETPDLALDRIVANFRRAGVDVPAGHLARIVPVVGDLSRPLMGLTEDEFDLLARSMDAVYHNGAVMNFVLTYRWMMPSHVGSTIDILRLVTRHRTKPLHLTSTLGVFLGTAYDRRPVTEAVRCDDPTGLDTGYNTTKWVADRMAVLARDRGVPVSIHRIAAIGGDVRTGRAQTASYLSRQIAACAQLGAVPDSGDVLDMLPVDRVGAAVAALSLDSVATDYHYYRSDGFTYADLGGVLTERGYPTRVLPFEQWRTLMLDHPETAFGPLAYGLSGRRRAHPVFDCTRTFTAAAAHGVEFPPADAEMLGRHVDHLITAGAMPERV